MFSCINIAHIWPQCWKMLSLIYLWGCCLIIKKYVVTSLDACRTQFYLQPLAPECAKSSQLELAQSRGTRRHTGVTPVTRRGCKVAVPWWKPGFSHGCWKVIFLQGLLLCISDGREKPSVRGQRFTAGTLSRATWSSEGVRAFLQLPPMLRWSVTQCRVTSRSLCSSSQPWGASKPGLLTWA